MPVKTIVGTCSLWFVLFEVWQALCEQRSYHLGQRSLQRSARNRQAVCHYPRTLLAQTLLCRRYRTQSGWFRPVKMESGRCERMPEAFWFPRHVDACRGLGQSWSPLCRGRQDVFLRRVVLQRLDFWPMCGTLMIDSESGCSTGGRRRLAPFDGARCEVGAASADVPSVLESGLTNFRGRMACV